MEIVPRFNIFIRCFDISINPNMFIIAKLKWNFISKDITKHSGKNDQNLTYCNKFMSNIFVFFNFYQCHNFDFFIFL